MIVERFSENGTSLLSLGPILSFRKLKKNSAISHLFNCISYIAHILFGETASCTTGPDSVLIENGPNGNSRCSTVLIIWEYFLFSSTLWWLILAYSWLLASKFKYSVEAIEAKSSIFHIIGWGVPGTMFSSTHFKDRIF